MANGAWERPRLLARLCVASFINQGVVFPLYLLGMLGAWLVQGMPEQEVEALVAQTWARVLDPAQQQAMQGYMAIMRAHGVALMGVLAARTLVRAVGTFRLWQGRRDGLHIYISAQLLGMLLPMLVAGPGTFNFFGFLIALNWCWLYFTQRHALRADVVGS
jgi:hypothetical protein